MAAAVLVALGLLTRSLRLLAEIVKLLEESTRRDSLIHPSIVGSLLRPSQVSLQLGRS